MPGVVLAHAVSVRSDLPAPLGVVLVAAALALGVSFVALGALWRTSRLRGNSAGRALPTGLERAIDHPLVRGGLRALVLAVAAFVVLVALVGPSESAFSIAPYAFYVTFWVGIVPVSLLLGPVWRIVNPLRTLYAGLARITGPAPGQDGLPRLGLWPATGFLLAYAWLELVYPDRAVPRTLGVLLVAYVIVQLVAALWYGPGWFASGDCFEAYSTLLARLSPLGRRADGRLAVRNPLDGADGTPAVPGLAAFVTALIGTTAFDGVSRATWYQSRSTGDPATATIFALVTVALVAALYAVATALSGRITRTTGAPNRYAHSLIPIVAGYAIAHYFSLLVFEGQLTWILASNPFARDGVDYFGTYSDVVNLTAVSAGAIAAVQIGAIVIGHVAGVVLAHDRAVRLGTSARTAQRSQYPLLAVMVAFTTGGLTLLLG